MKVTVRLPAHMGSHRIAPEPSNIDDDPHFIDRPCYVFNPRLARSLDDARCRHCRHYLTSACPHIDEFIEDVDDLSPE